jgi:tRNA(fMet)-specific endonuclease VapC
LDSLVAIQAVDTSSRSLGNAINTTVHELLDLLLTVPADAPTWERWLVRFWTAVEKDGVDYRSEVVERWGKLFQTPERASRTVEDRVSVVRLSWSPEHRGYFRSTTGCLFCQLAAGRYQKRLDSVDHNFGQRRSVRTADPTVRPRSVGSAVRTNDLAVGISSVVLAELRFGVRKSRRQEENAAALEDFLAFCLVLDWPQETSSRYAEIRADLESQGRSIGSNDLLIAAHTLWLGSTLVTNNLRDLARVPRLKTDNWIE